MIKQFLEHIWPSKGVYCIAVPKKNLDTNKSYFIHKTFISIDDAVANVNTLVANNLDVYMAVGTLLQPKVFNEVKQKDEIRTQKNIGWMKSLIFDIDVGEKKPYKTQQEAVKSLIDFTKEVALPIPTMISSGNGVHAYFTFDTEVDADTWYQMAIRLRALAKHFKLHIDNSRTCDRSSVLRVAGTYNFKNKQNPKKVEVKNFGAHSSPEDMAKWLDRAMNMYDVKLVDHTSSAIPAHIREDFAGVEENLQDNPANLQNILKQCKQMSEVKRIGGKVGYELRASATSIIKFCDDKDYSITTFDDPDPEKAEAQLQAMLVDSITNNPHKCVTFESVAPDNCLGCPLHGKDKSPISFGYRREGPQLPPPTKPTDEERKPVDEPHETIEVTEADDVDSGESATPRPKAKEVVTIKSQYGFEFGLPDPPFPYKRTKHGIFLEELGEEGVSTSVSIYQYDVYPYEIVEDPLFGTVVKIVAKLPHGNEKRINVPMSVLVDYKAFNKIFAEASIVPATLDQRNMLAGYMSSYVNEIQRLSKSTKNYPQLGWLKDAEGFVMPAKVFLQDGTEEASGVSKAIKPSTDSLRKKGSLDEWKKVINVYAKPGFEPYAFGHLVGYASILFRFTGYAGAMVNMVGDSGSGKSTVLQTINSIFGHPTESILMQHDTYNARINRLGVFNSICVAYDEITNIDAEELSNLCYSITQGRGKERLTQNAEVKENNTKWQLVVASTSNSNLMGKLSSLKHDASAESLRVFEYQINSTNMMTKVEARETFRELDDNYGHAGEIFVKYVIQNQKKVKTLIDQIMVKFDDSASVPTNERYWSAIVACVLAGGVIAKELGLCEYDIQSLFKWAVSQIVMMRGIVKDNKRDPRGLLVEFLNTHINHTIVAYGGADKDQPLYVLEDPKSGILIRSEVDKGLAYISKPAIRAWLAKGGSDYNWVKRILKDSRIILDEDANKVLSAGSKAYKIGQSKCWLVDLNHQEMAGAVTVPGIRKDAVVENIFKLKDKQVNE